MKTASPHGKDTASSAAIAHTPKGSGVSFPAPVQLLHPFFAPPHTGAPLQLQLDKDKPYRVNKTFMGFDSATRGKRKRLSKDTVWYVVDHDLVNATTKLYSFDGDANYYVDTGTHDGNFDLVGPELGNTEKADPSSFGFLSVYKNMAHEPTPDRTHPTQGNIGDCWLVAAMIAMAQSPHWKTRLVPLIASQNRTQSYNVQLYSYNAMALANSAMVPEAIENVKAVFAYYQDRGNALTPEFVYALQKKQTPDQLQANLNATPLWPAILEKALAQIRGGYQNLDDRDAREGLAVLSGKMPEQKLGAALDAHGWGQIQVAFGNDAAITFTTEKNSNLGPLHQLADEVELAKVNLAPLRLAEDHVYVLEAITNTHVTLYNPHGALHPAQLQLADVNTYIAKIDILNP